MTDLNIFKKINNSNFFGIVIISIFSLAVNQYYGNFGVFPHDSFSHFETGSMILNGFHPFKDFWVVSGPFIDYLQALIFYLFGISWKTYVLHASFINIVITIFTFIILRNLNLEFITSLFFSLCFAILAYPSSGTPFVDHHSTFLSLMGVYFILLSIKKNTKSLNYFIPLFFILAFFSKQVPSSYFIISVIPIYIIHLVVNKKFNFIFSLFSGSIAVISVILVFGLLNEINLKSFMEQYFFYPQSIASNRFSNFKYLSFVGVIGNFKFILISLLILIFAVAKSFKKTKFFKDKNVLITVILAVSSLVLIFHQIATRNQIYIFFLIPLIIGVANALFDEKIFRYFSIILCLVLTIKYHERFNEGRKFHELQNVNFDRAVDAKIIDVKLSGLKWVTPQYKQNPLKEVKIINEIKNYLKKDKRNKMVQGNYPFLSVVLDQDLFSTSRWHVLDGTDYPLPESSFFNSYKLLTKEIIRKNNIQVIYSISPVKPKNIYTLIDKECLKEIKINEVFFMYEIKKCKI